MFFLHVTITPEAVVSLKTDLAKTYPHVKSSHRVEALARAFGFSTFAAMLATSKDYSEPSAQLNWDAFNAYLTSHGFNVIAPPLYIAVARVVLQQLLPLVPELTMHGLGVNPAIRDPEGKEETSQEHVVRFRVSRSQFSDERAARQFLCAVEVMTKIKPLQSINKKADSLMLTRLVEGHEYACPDGQRLKEDYVSDGAVIAAAIYAGFAYEKHGVNAVFNMSQKSIDALFTQKEEMRPPMVERIADCRVTQEDLEVALTAFNKMKEEDRRDITARTMQLIRLFDKERPFREVSDIISAVEFRLEAFSRIASHPELRTFFPSKEDGAAMISQPVLHLVATEPLLSKQDRPAFDVKSFRARLSALPKEAFQS